MLAVVCFRRLLPHRLNRPLFVWSRVLGVRPLVGCVGKHRWRDFDRQWAAAAGSENWRRDALAAAAAAWDGAALVSTNRAGSGVRQQAGCSSAHSSRARGCGAARRHVAPASGASQRHGAGCKLGPQCRRLGGCSSSRLQDGTQQPWHLGALSRAASQRPTPASRSNGVNCCRCTPVPTGMRLPMVQGSRGIYIASRCCPTPLRPQELDSIRLKREAKAKNGFYVEPEAKLVFVVRGLGGVRGGVVRGWGVGCMAGGVGCVAGGVGCVAGGGWGAARGTFPGVCVKAGCPCLGCRQAPVGMRSGWVQLAAPHAPSQQQRRRRQQVALAWRQGRLAGAAGGMQRQQHRGRRRPVGVCSPACCGGRHAGLQPAHRPA